MAEALTRRFVSSRVRHWRKRLGLAAWHIRVEYGPDPDEGSEASCMALPEYGYATLRFDLPNIPPDEVDAWVVHELMHCYVWPLANAAHALAGGDKAKEEWVRTQEETLTTTLERLILRLVAE